MDNRFTKTDPQLKEELPEDVYKVAREGRTEAPFTGALLDNKEHGTYKCRVCGQELFSSSAKFDSGTGWPSFDEPSSLEHIELVSDDSLGMHRVEVRCKKCGSHLGHVFDDLPAPHAQAWQAGGQSRTGKRYCINSVCLDFEKQ